MGFLLDGPAQIFATLGAVIAPAFVQVIVAFDGFDLEPVAGRGGVAVAVSGFAFGVVLLAFHAGGTVGQKWGAKKRNFTCCDNGRSYFG